jgi:tetratricopeptide (TPR) repeat protein
VKHRNWLNITEYLLLIGSGVGTVATIASQQLLFTAAPVSVLFLLNLVNRNRLEELAQEHTESSVAQLDQKVSNEIKSLQKQVQALPSFLDLASLRKSIVHTNQETLIELAEAIELLKHEFQKPEWLILQQTVRQLQEQYVGLTDAVGNVTSQLSQLSRLNLPTRVDGLDGTIAQLKTEVAQLRTVINLVSEEQRNNLTTRTLQDDISRINRRLNQLPPPFDASALKQDVNSLIKVVGDMASRRELSQLAGQVEQLSQQNASLEQSVTPIKVATTILKKQLDTIATRIVLNQPSSASPQPHVIESLQATVETLEQGLAQLANADVVSVRSQIETIVATHLGKLQQQLQTVQEMTQTLDRQQRDLRDWVTQLPKLLDEVALQNQIKSVATRAEWAESLSQDVQAQVSAAVEQQLDRVRQELHSDRPIPEYELVFDVTSLRQQQNADASGCTSRAILEQALTSAQARLVIVYPYPLPETLDSDLILKFRDFLDRQGCLDLGWGHLGNISNGYHPRAIDRRRAINATEKGFLYDVLHQLMELKRQYPDQFRFKVLGTDENFLVCDRSFAILGSQSIPTASVVFPQAAVGLKTRNAEVIQELVDRFEEPTLEINDVKAYFKRAITRYDLGDRQGAIEDYTEVLEINPTDDVAYNNRGLAFYDLGDRAAAIADFDQAIQHNSENFIAYCNRGVIRSELGDKLGAIEDYTAALHINPDYTTAYFHRGLARTRMRNKLGAIEDYTEVICLNPQDGMAYFYRGLARTKVGDRAEAIQDLHQAAQRFGEQGDTANYQQTLKTLDKLRETVAIACTTQPLVHNGA